MGKQALACALLAALLAPMLLAPALLAAAGPALGAIISIENSLMPVLSVEASRQDRAFIGETFTIVYLVRNISNKPARHVTFDGHTVAGQNDGFPFDFESASEPIDELAPGATATISVLFSVDDRARDEGFYRVTAQFTCYDVLSSPGSVSTSDDPPGRPVSFFAITDVAVSFPTARPSLNVTALTVLEDDPDPREGFTIRLGLTNSSLLYDMRNVLVQIDGGENFEIMEISSRKEISRIPTFQTNYVDFRLRAKEGRTSNTIGLTTSFHYPGASAADMADKKEELFIPIRDNTPEESTQIPRVIVKRYYLSQERVLAGDRIDLTIEIENTNARPVKNVLINFGVESTGSDGGGASSSTVFAPVGSSNTFHVSEIAGRSTVANTITFAVDSGALARTYIVPVTISYEDDRGDFRDLSTRDNVNIQVTQQARLSVTSMTLPTRANVGMPTPVMAEFVNSGRVELEDFSVRLEGDFELMDATMYMPKLMIGATTSYTGMLIPMEEGEVDGVLIVSYLDNSNQEVEEEHPFTVSVMSFMDSGFPDGMFPPDDGRFPEEFDDESAIMRLVRDYWLTGAFSLVVIVQFIYIIRVKKKARDMFFDEE